MLIHLNLTLTHIEIETLSILLITFVGHVLRKRPARLLHQGQVFNIFMRAKEHLPRV
jgi:hypothetical protein